MKQFVFSNDPIDPALELGYLRNLYDVYQQGSAKRLGSGSNGSVFKITRRSDSVRFAIKVIPKIATDLSVPKVIRAAQISFIRREVEVLLTLRGTLNVAKLEQVFEDAHHVFLVMELCRGGVVVGRHSHYTEPETSQIIRSVLQTVAQANAHGIIHRDIKPENFLLLSKSKDAPVKAIDFGLAAFYSPQHLPVTAPQPSGTLWYMSPEATRGQWYPTSDVWSAGIMAAYMLIGICPFVDNVTPEDPSPARVFNSIRTEEFIPDGQKWSKLSSVTVDFVKYLLEKDPLKRPTAPQALLHPFLQKKDSSTALSAVDRPLNQTLVQRLQRFAQHGVFKRVILEHIAADFMAKHFNASDDVSPAHLCFLMNSMDVDSDGKVERGDLQAALQHMGYKVDDQEAAELFDAVDVERRGAVQKAELSASLLDWGEIQRRYAQQWTQSALRVFRELDRNDDGELDASEIAAMFDSHMEAYEVEAVVREALLEALGESQQGTPDAVAHNSCKKDAENGKAMKKSSSIEFKDMLHLLQSGGTMDDLHLFDPRISTSPDKQNFSLGQLDEAILARRRLNAGPNAAKRGSGKGGMRRALSLKCLG